MQFWIAERAWVRYAVVVALVALVWALFDRFGPFRSGAGAGLKPIERLGAGVTELERTLDGHYHISGQINGVPLVFMIDTGASRIAVDPQTAKRIKLDMQKCRPANFATAAGEVIGCETTAAEVRVGGLMLRDQRVAVMPIADDRLALLGMSVLKHFRIESDGSAMRLTPLDRR